MKKISILFLCLALICVFTLPAFAATSCEDWLNEAKTDELEKLEESIFSNEFFKATETHIYPMYHITDDAFFEKNRKILIKNDGNRRAFSFGYTR